MSRWLMAEWSHLGEINHCNWRAALRTLAGDRSGLLRVTQAHNFSLNLTSPTRRKAVVRSFPLGGLMGSAAVLREGPVSGEEMHRYLVT
jgi:hypothetical protein